MCFTVVCYIRRVSQMTDNTLTTVNQSCEVVKSAPVVQDDVFSGEKKAIWVRLFALCGNKYDQKRC